MINIDKIIDDYNETILEDKLKEEFNKKLNEDTSTQQDESLNYYRVLDNNEEPSIISTTSTITLDSYPSIVENDQVRVIQINKKQLLLALGLDEMVSTNSDDIIELTVKIKGRECDSFCNPINPEFPFDNNG